MLQPRREADMRMIRGVVLAVVLLAGCAGQPGRVAAPEKIVIGKQAWAAFESEYRPKAEEKSGVFALSTDGQGWGWWLCEATKCGDSGNAKAAAIKACKENVPAGLECFIFAVDGEPQVAYEVEG